MARRNRIGGRRHSATFEQHDGSLDANGNPTYRDHRTWKPVRRGWFCEVLQTAGGEVIRGRQVTARTRYVLYGEYMAVRNIKPEMRVKVMDKTLGVISVLDPEGEMREMRIEAGEEQ